MDRGFQDNPRSVDHLKRYARAHTAHLSQISAASYVPRACYTTITTAGRYENAPSGVDRWVNGIKTSRTPGCDSSSDDEAWTKLGISSVPG